MTNHSYPGTLIVFDGIDGAGKTTQVNKLKLTLEQAGLAVIVSKEPTDGKWGQKIRRSATTERMSLDDELHAFLQDRLEHLDVLIKPALQQGKTVILDRYYYSTICYQGARGADKEFLRETVMNAALKPDISLILDIDPIISKERIVVRDGAPNHFEGYEYLSSVREVYSWLTDTDPSLTKIDGSKSINEISSTIINYLIDNTFRDKLCFKSYGCDDEGACWYALKGMCDWSNFRRKVEFIQKSEIDRYPAIKG